MCPYIKVITRYLQTQKDIPEWMQLFRIKFTTKV